MVEDLNFPIPLTWSLRYGILADASFGERVLLCHAAHPNAHTSSENRSTGGVKIAQKLSLVDEFRPDDVLRLNDPQEFGNEAVVERVLGPSVPDIEENGETMLGTIYLKEHLLMKSSKQCKIFRQQPSQ